VTLAVLFTVIFGRRACEVFVRRNLVF